MASASSFKKKQKKNAFFMFMEEKRPQVEASGHKLRRGFADLAELLSDDWKALSPDEKKVYEERARNYNGNREVEEGQKKKLPEEDPDRFYMRTMRDAWTQEFERKRKENRALVWNMFETDDWAYKPIVVCNFSAFFEPRPLPLIEEFVPAEIGLTAFSLNDGILDNFARLIDPGDDIPGIHAYDASVTVKQNGLPAIGSCAELTDYEKLLAIVERFLAKYAGNSQEGYRVFALNSELEMVTKCMEWICENAGRSIRFRVLSLSRWAQLASTANGVNYGFRRPEKDDPADTSIPRLTHAQLQHRFQRYVNMHLMTTIHAYNRVPGESLTPVFFYPDPYPFTKFGVFLSEESVDAILTKNMNYLGYEELSCMYHMKKRDGAEFCALGISNRYAFCLLEYLTMSNPVKTIRRGSHYPVFYGLDVDETLKEREQRYASLGRWGLTELELNEKDEFLEMQLAAKEEEERKGMNGRRNRMEGQERPTNIPRQDREPKAQVEPVVRDEGGVRHPFSGDLPAAFQRFGLEKK